MKRFVRIPAFTIMEVTISMLLAAIVIGIAYTSYNIIVKSYSSYNSNNEQIANLAHFSHLLENDFQKADIIEKTNTGILLKDSLKTIFYKFDTNNIVRISEIIDTFKFKITEMTTSFEGKIILESVNNDDENRLDDLRLIISLQNEYFPIHKFKQYSSSDLFNRSSYASN